jgi:hypothetical protein
MPWKRRISRPRAPLPGQRTETVVNEEIEIMVLPEADFVEQSRNFRNWELDESTEGEDFATQNPIA